MSLHVCTTVPGFQQAHRSGTNLSSKWSDEEKTALIIFLILHMEGLSYDHFILLVQDTEGQSSDYNWELARYRVIWIVKKKNLPCRALLHNNPHATLAQHPVVPTQNLGVESLSIQTVVLGVNVSYDFQCAGAFGRWDQRQAIQGIKPSALYFIHWNTQKK